MYDVEVEQVYSHIVSLQRCRASKLFWVVHHLDILNHLFMSLLTCNVEGLTSYVCVHYIGTDELTWQIS